jgi:hypothetical protein
MEDVDLPLRKVLKHSRSGSCLKVVRMVMYRHDFPYYRVVRRAREQSVALALFSPAGVWLSAVQEGGRTGARVSSLQAGLSRLSVQRLHPGLQPLHRDGLCGVSAVSPPNSLAASRGVQGREQCQPSRGAGGVSEYGPPLAAESAGQRVHAIGRGTGVRWGD